MIYSALNYCPRSFSVVCSWCPACQSETAIQVSVWHLPYKLNHQVYDHEGGGTGERERRRKERGEGREGRGEEGRGGERGGKGRGEEVGR